MEYDNNKNINRFFKVISNENIKLLSEKKMSEEESNLAMKSFWSNIYGWNDTPRPDIQHSGKTLFVFNKLFRPFSEIITTLEMIGSIPIYIRNFPFKRHGISKAMYIQYHVGNYYVEVGNLRYRLTGYTGLIKNSYKNDNITDWKSFACKLDRFINKTFESVTDVRDKHVHQFRYTNKSIDRLSSLELYKKFDFTFKKMVPVDRLHDEAFKETRKFWYKQISSEISIIQKTVDVYFKLLLEVLTDNDKLIYPSGLKD